LGKHCKPPAGGSPPKKRKDPPRRWRPPPKTKKSPRPKCPPWVVPKKTWGPQPPPTKGFKRPPLQAKQIQEFWAEIAAPLPLTFCSPGGERGAEEKKNPTLKCPRAQKFPKAFDPAQAGRGPRARLWVIFGGYCSRPRVQTKPPAWAVEFCLNDKSPQGPPPPPRFFFLFYLFSRKDLTSLPHALLFLFFWVVLSGPAMPPPGEKWVGLPEKCPPPPPPPPPPNKKRGTEIEKGFPRGETPKPGAPPPHWGEWVARQKKQQPRARGGKWKAPRRF